jgi:myosin-5
VLTERQQIVEVAARELELCSTSATEEARVDDLTKLPDLHQPALLSALHERFKLDRVYSYSSAILLAVNPFKALPLYEPRRLAEYLALGARPASSLPPHAYAVANAAYHAMLGKDGCNQSILVSGESGAGKTVSTKVVLSFLTAVSAVKPADVVLLTSTPWRASRSRTAST